MKLARELVTNAVGGGMFVVVPVYLAVLLLLKTIVGINGSMVNGTPVIRASRGEAPSIPPGSKTAYVANPVTNDVSVVDIASMKETTRIPVGFVPKRNVTVSLQ